MNVIPVERLFKIYLNPWSEKVKFTHIVTALLINHIHSLLFYFISRVAGDCDPISISNGRADKNIYMYGELATISCDREYRPVGGNGDGTMSCDTNGQWSQLITCERKKHHSPIFISVIKSIKVLKNSCCTLCLAK